MGLNLPEEFEAPRLVEPRPLVDPRERFGDCPRARVLLPRSSIVLAANHEEEAGRRAEEKLRENSTLVSGAWSYCESLCYCLQSALSHGNRETKPI